MQSREIQLTSYPVGLPTKDHFAVKTVTLDENLKDKEVLVRNSYLSVDPYMRGRMSNRKSYIEPFPLNQALTGSAVGTVVKSRNPDLPEGTLVEHFNGWREAFIAHDARQLRKVPNVPGMAPSAWLGALGVPGLTAYVGLIEIAKLKEGETVFISGAAGAVGSLAGQIAKAKKCRVIGTAGSDAKTAWLKEIGYDFVMNYKKVKIAAELAKAAPEGLHVYFDNVGGDHLEAALSCMRDHGRIALCGAISLYNNTEASPGPSNLANAIGKRLTMRGFIVSDHMNVQAKFVDEALAWHKSGHFQSRETVYEGLDRMPEAFIGLFNGDNTGKMLVKL